MDDIGISGDSVPERVIWKIRQQIHKRELHYHKEHRYTGGIGEVTGIVIRDGRLIIPNRQRKKAHEIRLAIDQAADKTEIAKLANSLRGLNVQRQQVENQRRSPA